MALSQPELATFSGSDIFADYEQVSLHERIVAIFGTDASASTLSRCTPVGFNETTEFYGEWIAADPAILEVDTGGASGGTWTATVDGTSIGNLAYNATAAVVTATLLGLGYEATVDLTAGVYTITFDAQTQIANVPTLTGSVASLTGGTGEAATVTAGTSTYGLNKIIGFVWPDEIVLNATTQVQGTIMTEGRIAYSYIEATVDAGDVTALKAELKSEALARGIIVEGLANIH